MTTATTKTSTSEKISLGPKPYNRFLGNPPTGKTPEEAFKDENGYDWLQEISIQPLRDLIDNLESENTNLKTQVASLTAEVENLKTHAAHTSSSHKK